MTRPSKNITHVEIMEDDNISELTSVVSSGAAPLPEARVPRLHPSRAHQDGDLDDALEYYAPKTKKISGDSADEVAAPQPSPPSRDLNHRAASYNAIPGAYRVPPSSLLASEGNREEQNPMNSRNNHSDDSSDSKKSMYIIPNASLVGTADHSQTIYVSQEPELVFASPLDVGILQEQHQPTPNNSPSLLSKTAWNGMELQNMKNNSTQKLVSGDDAVVKSNQAGVILVNKRVLWLVLVVSCLAVAGLVSGVAYYVATSSKSNDTSTPKRTKPPRDATASTTNTGNNGGGGGNGGGTSRRYFLRTR